MTSIEQVVFAGDDIQLIVLPGLGARMHSLRVRGTQLLRSPVDVANHASNPFFWGGFVMAPWCNRLTTESVRVGDNVVHLASNFRDGSAIHGQVYVAPWQQVGNNDFAIERVGDGWPWPYRVDAHYAVAGTRIEVVLRLRNLSDHPMPGGTGLHPWFPWPVEARINCALTYGSNTAPDAAPVPVTGDLDVRSRRTFADGVDSTWTDAGQPPVELWWPHHKLHARIEALYSDLHVTAANAADVQAIAVEPQTHAPQGLRRLLNDERGALAWIRPGDELTLPITIEFDWTS